MNAAIKLVFIDLLFIQIVGPILAAIPYSIYLWVTTGVLDETVLMQHILIPAQLIGLLLVAVYLWFSGYISIQRKSWSFISTSYLMHSVMAVFTLGILVASLMDQLKWIPNTMEQSFDILQSGIGGLLAIALLGPLVEELLFRGAILSSLLKQYSPMKSILISSFLFGVFHLNPAQMIPAFLIGILFAWTRWQTGSLVPSILMHVLNNSFAVYVSLQYPEIEDVSGLAYTSDSPYLIFLLLIALVFIFAVCKMNRIASSSSSEKNVYIK